MIEIRRDMMLKWTGFWWTPVKMLEKKSCETSNDVHKND